MFSEQNVDGIQLSRDSANDTTEEIAFINETSESSEAQAVENKTSEISHVKSKFKCVQKNYTEGQVKCFSFICFYLFRNQSEIGIISYYGTIPNVQRACL